MPSTHKSTSTHKPTNQSKPVVAAPQTNMVLSLATSTWEIIITALTSQITQLRQQVGQQAEAKPQLCMNQCIKAQKERDRKKVKWCKQTIHNSKKQPVLLSRDFTTCRNTGRSIHKICQQNARPANLFTRTIKVRHPRQTTVQLAELVTQKRRTATLNPTHSQHEGQITVKEWPGTDRACQTDKIMESRGVNTILKAKQRILPEGVTRVAKVSPTRHFEKKCQQEKTSMKKTSITKKELGDQSTDVSPQNQQPTQEHNDAEEKTEIIEIKIPESSRDLLCYTKQKIEQLIDSGHIHLPEKKRNVCVFCKKEDHNVSECVKMRERSDRDKSSCDPSCYVCSEEHELVNCGWIQIIDTVMSLSNKEQDLLYPLCPYVKEPIANPKRILCLMFTWNSQSITVRYMDPQCFRFPYYTKPKETRGKRQAPQAEARTTKTTAKVPSPVTSIGQDFRRCFFCKSDLHLVKSCVLFQQKKVRRKRTNENTRAKVILQ